MEGTEKLSDRLEAWLRAEGARTLGSLVDLFGEKSFAVLFVLLMAVPALPLPTGGVTHLLELIAMLLALELIAGRRQVWLPERWRRREIGPAAQERFAELLLKRIRWVERRSRPRLRFLLSARISDRIYGLLVFVLALAAFIAPPFTGLDTLPSMGAVAISLGVLFEDALVVLVGLVLGIVGVVLVATTGGIVIEGVGDLI